MKIRFLTMVAMTMLVSNAVINSAEARSECFNRCTQEMKACEEKIGAIKPYTEEEQQQLDACYAGKADCDSACADGTAPPPEETQKNKTDGSESGVPEGPGQ